jgi:hypothetical protein
MKNEKENKLNVVWETPKIIVLDANNGTEASAGLIADDEFNALS